VIHVSLENVRNRAETGLISTMHWVLHTEFNLDYPVCDVWPVFKDMRSWYAEYAFEDVSGPAYRAGSGLLEDQVLGLTSSKGLPRVSKSDAAGPELVILKTLKVNPCKEIVAVLSGRAYDWKHYTAFYVWRMTEQSKNTTIFVDTYGEAELIKPLPQDAFSEYHDAITQSWHRSWADAFAELKKVMSADHCQVGSRDEWAIE
jgi:hypothetical protein